MRRRRHNPGGNDVVIIAVGGIAAGLALIWLHNNVNLGPSPSLNPLSRQSKQPVRPTPAPTLQSTPQHARTHQPMTSTGGL